MNYTAIAFLLCLGLFFGVLILLELGRRLGRWTLAKDFDQARARVNTIETAIFLILGLMIAFTFSGAATRYELRRQLVVDEANAIGTAYLRLDLLSSSAQPSLREKFRRYVELRIDALRIPWDTETPNKQAAETSALQKEIWSGVIDALKESPPQSTIVMIPALNQMIDITTTRAMAALTHTPILVFSALIFLTLTSALLAGFVMAGSTTRHMGVHSVAFALVLTATVYIIFDLDYPRFGVIRIEFADQALRDLLVGMK
ncbi:hypothetical protein AYO43_02320 [Nitrospira sp. SCGC AG-212-E16]|nr:hypothetical protein AYO43_02320 [Nitrospira sp. SCGC AG-212-E16]